MEQKEHRFFFSVYDSIDELADDDAALLKKARQATATAYAPYSAFKVGAIALLENGEEVSGSNQENASFPVGLCAERVVLAAIASRYPGKFIQSLAISYHNEKGHSDHPVTPCGICRQSLQEFEDRSGHPVRLILGGMEGKVYIIPSAGSLLPLGFNGAEL